MWPCHSLTSQVPQPLFQVSSQLGNLTTHSLTESRYFYFWHTKRNPGDFWPLKRLGRVYKLKFCLSVCLSSLQYFQSFQTPHMYILYIIALSLLVRSEIRDPPGNFQETLKFPGALEISRGPGFFQVLEIFRPPWNFQVFVCFIPMENSRGGQRKMYFSKHNPTS